MGLNSWKTHCNGWLHCLKIIDMKRKHVTWGIQLINTWHLDIRASNVAWEWLWSASQEYLSLIRMGDQKKRKSRPNPASNALSLSILLQHFFSAAISSIHQDQRQYRREVSKSSSSSSSSNVYSREERRRSGVMADSSDFLTIGGRGSSSSVIILPSQVSCGGPSEPSAVPFNS